MYNSYYLKLFSPPSL